MVPPARCGIVRIERRHVLGALSIYSQLVLHSPDIPTDGFLDTGHRSGRRHVLPRGVQPGQIPRVVAQLPRRRANPRRRDQPRPQRPAQHGWLSGPQGVHRLYCAAGCRAFHGVLPPAAEQGAAHRRAKRQTADRQPAACRAQGDGQAVLHQAGTLLPRSNRNCWS